MKEYEEVLKDKSYRWNITRFANKECLSTYDWKLSKSQEGVLDYLKYKENEKIIISAAAGVGKTLSMAIFSVWIAGVLSYELDKRLTVNILGGSQKQSKICYRYIKEFLDNSEYLSERLKKKPLKTKTIFDNGSRIAALTASSKSVRGEHADVLIIDEAVEVEDSLINAALPRVNTQVFPKKILCSTPHSYSSYFVDLWNKADDFDFEKFHWSAEDVDWKEDDEIEEAKEFYDDSVYKIEYQGTPSAVSGTVVKQDDMKHSIVSQEYKPDFEAFKTAGVDWGTCLEIDTEVLTKEGWKRLNNIDLQDTVFTLNPDNLSGEWQEPKEIELLDEPVKAEFATVNNRNFSYSATVDHPLPLSKLSEPDKIIDEMYYEIPKFSSHRFLRLTPDSWEGEEIEYWHDLRVKLLGWYLSEGCLGQDDRIELYQDKYRDEIIKLLEDYKKEFGNKIYYKEDESRFILYDKELAEILRPLGLSIEKYIPKEVKELPRRKLKILINCMWKGDGETWTDKPKRIYTASEELAEDIQEVGIKAGFSTSLSSRKRKTNKSKRKRRMFRVSLKNSKRTFIGKERFEIKTKKTKRGSLRVPNGIICIRRNGKTSFVHNTHATAIVVLQNVDNYLQVIDSRAWKHQKYTWLHNQIKSICDNYEIDLVYGDNSHKGENERLQKDGVNMKSIPITGNKKGNLISELRFNFEIGKVKIPAKFKKLIRQLKRYTRDTKRGDDLVDALMLSIDAQEKVKNTVERTEPLWSSG